MPAKQARLVVSGGDVGAGSWPCTSYWFYGFSALAPVDGMSALWRTARMQHAFNSRSALKEATAGTSRELSLSGVIVSGTFRSLKVLMSGNGIK